ncbi:hypothetical protein BC833DRAFT_573458 [Globomyces pollinis-pini]|nr:hypothetical protein BC833DRAFT_573458 [Globomyces pollinis-pini]KAJ3000974.1 hypothetical protein HDV02_000043 [Globomyces sp. JEL0801]
MKEKEPILPTHALTLDAIDLEIAKRMALVKDYYLVQMDDPELSSRYDIVNQAQTRAIKTDYKENTFKLYDTAPTFTVETSRGEWINLDDLTQKAHVLIIFCIGGWSVYCMSYLAMLQNSIPIFKEKGMEVLVLSAESTHAIAKNERKFNLSPSLHFASDPLCKIIKKFGLANEWTQAEMDAMGELCGFSWKDSFGKSANCIAVPAAFLIQKQTRKIFLTQPDVDYSNRTKLTDIDEALDRSIADFNSQNNRDRMNLAVLSRNPAAFDIRLKNLTKSLEDVSSDEIDSATKELLTFDYNKPRVGFELFSMKETRHRNPAKTLIQSGTNSVVPATKTITRKSNGTTRITNMSHTPNQIAQMPLASAFTLLNPIAQSVDLYSVLKASHVILAFQKGSWITCSKVLKSLQKQLGFYFGKQTVLLSVSTDPSSYIIHMVLKYRMSFQILSDPSNQIGTQFGIGEQIDVSIPQETPIDEKGNEIDNGHLSIFMIQKKTGRIYLAERDWDLQKSIASSSFMDMLRKMYCDSDANQEKKEQLKDEN